MYLATVELYIRTAANDRTTVQALNTTRPICQS